MDLKQFGEQLRILRQAAGWSQEALIEALDQLARSGAVSEYRVIDGTLLSRWERAHTQKGRSWKPTRSYLLYLIQLFAPHLDLVRAQAWAEWAGYTVSAAELQAWFPTVALNGTAVNTQSQPTDQAQATTVVAHNLPTLLTSFVGRVAETTRILDYLSQPTARLITVVGEGGAGKTRLALEVAHQVVNQGGDQYRDGVYFVALVGVSAASFVVSALVNTLGLALVGADDPQQQLLAHLQKRRLLLVLDNFEQLVAEATPLLTAILQTAPGVHLLVTSRERLNLVEEWVVALNGLACPPMAAANQKQQSLTATPALSTTAGDEYAAVQLFRERARQAQAEFGVPPDASQPAAIARICSLLQGIPLGIEMAAAWVHMLSCTEIADEIARNLDFLTSPHRHVPERHRSLRAVFEQSWRLLNAVEQGVLAALAVFQGGFTREAAASVAKASLLTLRSLVDKSLLKVAEGRYELHELLRQFAEEKLCDKIGEAQAAATRHAAYYGSWLQQNEILWDNDQAKLMTVNFQREIQNLHTGWRHAVIESAVDVIEQYSAAFLNFYTLVSWPHEGKKLFEFAVDSLSNTSEHVKGKDAEVKIAISYMLVKVMIRKAVFERFLGQPRKATQLLQRSGELLRSLPSFVQDDGEWTRIYHMLGLLEYDQGNYQIAQQHLYCSLERVQKINNRSLQAPLYTHLGAVEFALGNYIKARQWYQSSMELYYSMKRSWGMANVQLSIGRVAEALGECNEAKVLYQQSLDLFTETGNSTGIAECNIHLGVLAEKRADFVEAQARYQQSLVLYQANGEQLGLIRTLNHLGSIACRQRDYVSAYEYLRRAFDLSVAVKATPLTLRTLLSGAQLLLTSNNDYEQDKIVSPILTSGVDLSISKAIDAFTLLTLVSRHSATDFTTRRQAQNQLEDLTRQLPAQLLEQLTSQLESPRFRPEAVMTSVLTRTSSEESFFQHTLTLLNNSVHD